MSLHVDVVGTSVPKILQIRFPVEAATSALECYCSYYACLLETATSFRAGCVFFLPIFLRPRTLGRYFMIVEGLYAFKERNIKAKTKMHTLQTPALQHQDHRRPTDGSKLPRGSWLTLAKIGTLWGPRILTFMSSCIDKSSQERVQSSLCSQCPDYSFCLPLTS